MQKTYDMNVTSLNSEQNAIVNAVWTLIENMDDKMKKVLLDKLSHLEISHAATINKKKHKWENIPISKEVMDMTFPHRKDIPTPYDETIADELQKKYL